MGILSVTIHLFNQLAYVVPLYDSYHLGHFVVLFLGAQPWKPAFFNAKVLPALPSWGAPCFAAATCKSAVVEHHLGMGQYL
jgi:hypothetical protein